MVYLKLYQMKRKCLIVFPEIIIMLLSAYWFMENYFGSGNVNLFALGVFLILLFQVIFQNKFIGMFMATITSLFSLYMVLAVISEFSEFPTVNGEALRLLLFGLLFCLLLFMSSIIMIYKFLTRVF